MQPARPDTGDPGVRQGSGRVSIAGLVCVRPGDRSRSIYRVLVHRGRQGERRSFAETDYAALLDAAHQQLGDPIVVIRDNLNTHVSAATRTLIASRNWLQVIRLPAYAPDLNPVERIWSHLTRAWHPGCRGRRPPGRDREESTQAHPVPARADRCVLRPDRLALDSPSP